MGVSEESTWAATVFEAMGHPRRVEIVRALGEFADNPSALSRRLGCSWTTIAKHLKVLQKAGLITQGRQAQWRPCRLEAKPLREVADWVEQYRRFWEESLDRLEEYLKKLQSEDPQRGSIEA